MSKEPIGWITVHGKHVPLFEGESKADAVQRAMGGKSDGEKISDKSPDDTKSKQIEANKKEGDKLNSEHSTQSEHKRAIKELSDSKYEDGTYDITTKKTVSFDDGYQVTFCQIGDNYSDSEYQQKVNECLRMSSDGKTYAGKFESEPEISFHCKSREQAIAYAKANNQISIWDWKNCDEIKTGGTGRR